MGAINNTTFWAKREAASEAKSEAQSEAKSKAKSDTKSDAHCNTRTQQSTQERGQPLSLGAELFLMLAQVHRLCTAVLINAHIGSIGRICA